MKIIFSAEKPLIVRLREIREDREVNSGNGSFSRKTMRLGKFRKKTKRNAPKSGFRIGSGLPRPDNRISQIIPSWGGPEQHAIFFAPIFFWASLR